MQQWLSDRLHARGDAYAARAGWTTTSTTGRYGFGARMYHDPRFSQRRLTVGLARDSRHVQAVVTGGPRTSEPKPGEATAPVIRAIPDATSTGQRRVRKKSDVSGLSAGPRPPGSRVHRDARSTSTARR